MNISSGATKFVQFLQQFVAGIKRGDLLSLVILIGLIVLVIGVASIILNVRIERRRRKLPPLEWGSKSSRYRK